MRTILVIREFDKFSCILIENKFEVINLPLIATKAIDDLSSFESTLAGIEAYDGVFLTSSKATEIFRAKLLERGINYGGRVYVLGQRSYEMLKNEKLDFIFNAAANGAEEMLQNLSPGELHNKRFLFARGERSLRAVPKFLAATATIDEVIVYQTVKKLIEVSELRTLREKFENKLIACTCFFSPSGAESFIEQCGGEILHLTKIAAIGRTTAGFLEESGFKVDLVAAKSTAENFAAELVGHLKSDI